MELLQLNRYQSNVKKTKEENKAWVDSAQEKKVLKRRREGCESCY